MAKAKSTAKGKKPVKEKLPSKISRTLAKEEKEIVETSKRIKREETETDTDEGETLSKEESEDYLLRYQYGREMQLGDPRSNPREGKAKIMKDALLLQPKVSILIPVESGSDPSVPFSVNLNGYRLDLPRNTYIEVPKQIAEVVMQSQKQTVEALAQFRVNRNKDVEDAL